MMEDAVNIIPPPKSVMAANANKSAIADRGSTDADDEHVEESVGSSSTISLRRFSSWKGTAVIEVDGHAKLVIVGPTIVVTSR